MSTLGPLDGHVVGNILAALCTTDESGFYHWVIYVCTENDSGYKFHAHNDSNKGPWRYHRGKWDALSSIHCVCITKIGRLAEGKTWEDVDRAVEHIPMAVPDVDRPRFGNMFTCLVWFREAIRKLHTAGISRVIDLDRLEENLRQLATAMEYRRRAGYGGNTPVIMAPSDYTY
ncbi:hypothetical protein TRAPUB_12129 [Trametes pubescens]|uniref:Uncharacterized protein n=1 Tax=Trametes pubescens TaxID=154538 RepID=A0A1M2VUN9_TRAPU|nr:hypothetical protein TRAPUB_12129 [Trametes pubescens]